MTANMWIGGALVAGFLVGRKTSVLSRTVGFVAMPVAQPQAVQTTTASPATGAAVVTSDVLPTNEAAR